MVRNSPLSSGTCMVTTMKAAGGEGVIYTPELSDGNCMVVAMMAPLSSGTCMVTTMKAAGERESLVTATAWSLQ